MKAKGALTIGILGLVSLGIAGCGSPTGDINTAATQERVYTEMSHEDMVDPHYMVEQLVKYEGGICYDGGWHGTQGEAPDIAILFEDEATEEAFFAYTPAGSNWAYSMGDAALAASNCDESFVVYGKKVIDDQGNPQLNIGALEFKLGPYRTSMITYDRDLSPR